VYIHRLSEALRDLYLAHGGHPETQVDLHRGKEPDNLPPALLPWRRWSGKAVTQSEIAQRAFHECAEEAAEEYRQVRYEIERRIAEHRTQRLDEKIAGHHRIILLQQIALRPLWTYAISSDDSTIFVHRRDISPLPAPPGSSLPSSPSLTAGALEAALWACHGEKPRHLKWDTHSRSAIETECRQQGVNISFESWWQAVSQQSWTPSPSGPTPLYLRSTPRTNQSGNRGGYGSGTSGSGGFGGYTG
jgi:hypothetical protein